MNSRRIAIKTSALFAISVLVASTFAGAPADAQTVANKTNTQAYRNSLPPCATSSCDINVCDLPFIRSQSGSPQYSAPATMQSNSAPATNNLVSSEYDQYLDAPTDDMSMKSEMVEGSFDNPSPSVAPALQWKLNGAPMSSSNASCGLVSSSCGQASSACGPVSSSCPPVTSGCGTKSTYAPACQPSTGAIKWSGSWTCGGQ